MFYLIVSLLEKNQWSSLTGLIDSSSIAEEYLARGILSFFNSNFNGGNSDLDSLRFHSLTYKSSKGYSEVEGTLREMSKVSRSKKPNTMDN
jgi:hypothetical protein